MSIDHNPQLNEKYRCEKCGMELEITKACRSNDGQGPELRCCGTEMTLCQGDPGEAMTPEAQRNVYTA